MPLLEVQKITHVTAVVQIESSVAATVDQYAAFIQATADEVITKALEYVFSKDKDFQKFLASDLAASVPGSLHVRDTRNGTRRSQKAAAGTCR